jgi:hypothetical protein
LADGTPFLDCGEKGFLAMAQRGTTAKIDMAELERLSAMQCTDEEIAAWFKVTTRTIERRRKNRAFGEVMDRGKAKGRISVRRMQMKLLEQGNATMGVWLGKQILGQTDEIRHEVSGAIISVFIPSCGPATPISGNAVGTGQGRQLVEASNRDGGDSE